MTADERIKLLEEKVECLLAGKPWEGPRRQFFRYGPNGQKAIFERDADVPEGWADSPDRVQPVKRKAA